MSTKERIGEPIASPPGPKTAAVYARVSTAEQAVDATSLDDQVERCEAYAKAMGWDVIATYIDKGATGASALADRKQGKLLFGSGADVIITWSIDRFTRSAYKGLTDIENLEQAGKSLVFVKEAVVTSTPSGRLFRTMLTAFAEFEREQIRDRSMSGRFGAAEAEKWPSGSLPYGYLFHPDDGDIVIDHSEAVAIKAAFTLRVEHGWGFAKIAEHLNEGGYHPRPRMDRSTGKQRVGKFSAGSIQTYITNEAYKGAGITRNLSATLGGKKKTFTYPAPAIVDERRWDAAQTI